MDNNAVHIAGGASFVGTSLMRSLRAMGIAITGNDIHHQHIQPYLTQWKREKATFDQDGHHVGLQASKVVITIASDYILKNELPTNTTWSMAQTLAHDTYPHATKILVIMPFNKHDLQIDPRILVQYFGQREEDLRQFKLIKLFEDLFLQVKKANPHAQITKTFLSDVYGQNMPLSPSHQFFYALAHPRSENIHAQHLLEHHFPTHINDVVNGLTKLLFSSEYFEEVALINDEKKNIAMLLPKINSTLQRNWYLAHDYTINTGLIEKTKQIFPWYTKHKFNYRKQKIPTTTYPYRKNVASARNVGDKVKPISITHGLVFLSGIAILTLGAIPFLNIAYDLNQVEKALARYDHQNIAHFSQATTQHVEQVKWLLTIFQKREQTEDLLYSLATIQDGTQDKINLQSARSEGLAILANYASGNATLRDVETWLQKLTITNNAFQTSITTTEVLPQLDEHILGYATIVNDEVAQTAEDLTMLSKIADKITSEANGQLSIQVISNHDIKTYLLTTSSQGATITESSNVTPLSIQLHADLLEGQEVSSWLTGVLDKLSSSESNLMMYRQITSWYKNGSMRIINNSLPCSSSEATAMCIILNTPAVTKISQQHGLLTLSLQRIPSDLETLTVQITDQVRPTDIQDQYPREMDKLKVLYQGDSTYLTYSRPENTASTIQITFKMATQVQEFEVFTPLGAQSSNVPSRIMIPLK